MKIELYRVPGNVVGNHHTNINAIIDTWESLLISLDDWKASVYDIGIVDYAPKNRVTNWIIDLSDAQGVFKPDVQEFRKQIARPKLEKIGIKFLFVVLPISAIGKLSARSTSKLYSGAEGGMQSFEVGSIQEALDILKEAKEI